MTIWVNVTTTVDWSGVPFGIVRVESNVARELSVCKAGLSVRFCVWDARRQAFVEFPRDRVIRRLRSMGDVSARSALGVRDSHDDGPASVANNPLRDQPHLIRDSLPRRLRRIVSMLRAVAVRLVRSATAMVRRNPIGAQRPAAAGCLARGDVLITLGGEWEYGFMPLLPELRQRLHIRIIGCCHDLIPVKYPQYCLPYVVERFPEYLTQLARSCDAIACVSEASSVDLRAVLTRMGEPVPTLFSIRLGCTLPAGEPGVEVIAPEVLRLIRRPYVLFVSTIERRKNHEVLYRVYHRLAQRHDPETLPILVCVGSLGWGVDELLHDIAVDPRTQGLIVLLHCATDRDLCALYENALFCVFPSLCEGWGLPVAEALAFGKPVICSDLRALREVGGELVEYVDPWDLPGWVIAIEQLWLDPARRRRQADNIERRFQRPRWADTGSGLAQVALELEVN